jgi:hypothetical protein
MDQARALRAAYNPSLEVVMSTIKLETRPSRMGVLHAVAVGAAVLGFLFVLLWAGEALGIGPSTDALMRALTDGAREASLQALIRGLPVALVFGAIGGAMLAVFANLFRFLDRSAGKTS